MYIWFFNYTYMLSGGTSGAGVDRLQICLILLRIRRYVVNLYNLYSDFRNNVVTYI